MKAKDIDIQRLEKRNKRLEKLNEINKNLDGVGGGRDSRVRNDIIQEEEFEETQNFGVPNLSNLNNFGVNQGIETQVNQELLQYQNQNAGRIRPPVKAKYP